MTEDEVTKVLGDLHTLHLVNEPNNIDDLIYSWLAFFSQDDARVIAKACYIYTKIRKNRFWPSPGDIEELKLRASWLVEMDDNKEAEALGGTAYTPNRIKQSHLPPRAPAIRIAEQAQSFCDLCGLCDIRDQSRCPIDF